MKIVTIISLLLNIISLWVAVSFYIGFEEEMHAYHQNQLKAKSERNLSSEVNQPVSEKDKPCTK